MPWQGNEDNLIDRFDVRAHLDWISEPPETIDVDIALTSEDRHINYERYRIIVQNEFLGGKFLVLILSWIISQWFSTCVINVFSTRSG